eukprot:58795_1
MASKFNWHQTIVNVQNNKDLAPQKSEPLIESSSFEETKNKLNKIIKKYNIISAQYDQARYTEIVVVLKQIDNIGREKFIHKLEEHKNRSRFAIDNIEWIANKMKQDWRDRTQRNYPNAIPQANDENTFNSGFIYLHNEEGILKYEFKTRRSTDRMLLVNYNKLIDDTFSNEFLNNIKTLQQDSYDYRYPIESLILQSKLNDPSSGWYCDYDECWYYNQRSMIKGGWAMRIMGNSSNSDTCEKCDKTRRKDNVEELNIIAKPYESIKTLVKYNNVQYLKWKIRIQDVIDPLLNNEQNMGHWIPSMFCIDGNYRVKIKSNIHNLSRVKYFKLYYFIAKIFEKMIPMFEWILGDIKMNNLDSLEVIVGIQDYQLYPEQIYYGALHREGYTSEEIEGVGVYYFDKSDFIEDDIFMINRTVNGSCGSVSEYDEDIVIKNQCCLVFNNKNLNHKLKILKNGSKSEYATRKILTFFLPEYRNNNEISVLNERIYEFIVVNWIKLNNIGLFESSLVDLIISYLFNVMKQIAIRDGLRKNRIKPNYEQKRWVGAMN